MKKILILIIFFCISLGLSLSVRALDEVDALQKQIDETQKLLDLSKNATTPLESEVRSLSNRINGALNQIAQLKVEQTKKETEIKQQEAAMADQYHLFSSRIDQQYRHTRVYSPFVMLLSSWNSDNTTQAIKYSLTLAEKDKQTIEEIGGSIIDLQNAKKAAAEQAVKLASLQTQMNAQKAFFEKEITGAKAYQAQLQTTIAALSAQQQAILSARSGSFITSVGEVPLADDFNASIGYKDQAPGNSFAVFSFGGYTHRNGMSQYGAKARAEAGQSVDDILKEYYPNATLKKDYSAMENITVDGYGSISFEGQYLQGIYEMPMSWHENALKAQAIAARTYAIRRTNNGSSSICTTEACQVFKNSPKGGAWERAVNETRGWVLVDGGGSPVSTQYASTHGAYSNTGGWDTTTGDGSGDWSSNSWERKANSPWFYKSWYRDGYSSSGANCGKSHPWLSQEEMADIINAWIVRVNTNGADTNRIVPVTINTCNIGGGGNPYSMDELKNLANSSGGAVTSISSVTVNHNDNAQTATVRFQTNRGEISIPGSEFKSTFNIRAPGYLRIPQSSFAFFNIEHKR